MRISLYQLVIGTWLCILNVFVLTGCAPTTTNVKGNIGIVVERSSGRVQIVDTVKHSRLARVEGLGDLSHASVVYSPDERYAFVFGRDGGLTKVNLRHGHIEQRVRQAGNSIGGAISQDGSLVAVSNYQPGGVKIFDAETLTLLADIPAVDANGQRRDILV